MRGDLGNVPGWEAAAAGGGVEGRSVMVTIAAPRDLCCLGQSLRTSMLLEPAANGMTMKAKMSAKRII